MTGAPSSHRTRILVVEDEVIIAEALQQDLCDLGYDVPEVALSEDEVLEKARRLRPDLILMDVNLKGRRDGIQLAEELLAEAPLPIIILTAYIDQQTLDRARRGGSVGYLVKPYERRQLHTTIQMGLTRHRILHELRRTTEWFLTSLNSISDGILLTDRDARVTFANPAAANLLGVPAENLPGRPVDTVVRLADPSAPGQPANSVLTALRDLLVVAHHDDQLLQREDEQRIYVTHTASPIRDALGAVIGCVLTLRDTTEKRARELEASKLRNLEALGRLAGGIAHDFNNLLTIIVANASMLKFQAQDMPQFLPQLERIQHAADRAAAITSQFLTFAKGGAPLQREVSLRPLLQAALQLFSPEKNLEVRLEVPGNIDNIRVDETQISQVLQNLLNNAREAMPRGGVITIRAENIAPGRMPKSFIGDRDLPYVRLSVADTGVGIPEENLSKIFDPYFSTKPGGIGLGLSSVHSIINRHNGYLMVESVVGQGSEFTFYLPATGQTEVLSTPAAPAPPGSVEKPGRILVMDDEEMVRISVRRMLENIGCEVETAVDGEDALTRYVQAREAEQPFDMVLLDLLVPHGMGGTEAARQLLKVDPDAKIIVASGYSSHPVISQFRTYGFKAVLQKPFGMVELKKTLRSLGISVGTRAPF